MGIIIAQRGFIIYANAEALRLFGVSTLDDLIGQPFDYYIPRPQSREITVSTTQIPVLMGAQNTLYYSTPVRLYSLTDMTTERTITRALERVSRGESLALFARGVIHDMSNLMTALQGGLQLSQGIRGDAFASLDDYYDSMHAAMQQMARLITSLRTYIGQQSVVFRDTELTMLVAETVTALQPTAIIHDISIDLTLPDNEIVILGDTIQIQQVVNNLLINAIDAVQMAETDKASRISVSVFSDDDGYVSIIVEDTGVGIPAAALERVFDPFYSTKGEARGVGLSTASGIVIAHGGQIVVASEEGVGTTMTVILPVKR